MTATGSTFTTGDLNEFRATTWEECEAKVAEIEKGNATSRIKLLFRGQRDAAWRLDTTLERRLPKGISVLDYYRTILSIAPEVSTYFGQPWNLPNFDTIDDWCKDYDKFTLGEPPAYEFLVYLRHHGFPSPLLDWSRSLYIAAYFAFSNVNAGDIAIFVFSEQPDNTKLSSSSAPQIHRLGPYVKTHRRHFRQQADYTFCAKFESGTGIEFRSHEDVFKLRRIDQDVLWKINIPAGERLKVLTTLDKFNLNAFSLFDSEESLMETLAFRELDLKSGHR